MASITSLPDEIILEILYQLNGGLLLNVGPPIRADPRSREAAATLRILRLLSKQWAAITAPFVFAWAQSTRQPIRKPVARSRVHGHHHLARHLRLNMRLQRIHGALWPTVLQPFVQLRALHLQDAEVGLFHRYAAFMRGRNIRALALEFATERPPAHLAQQLPPCEAVELAVDSVTRLVVALGTGALSPSMGDLMRWFPSVTELDIFGSSRDLHEDYPLPAHEPQLQVSFAVARALPLVHRSLRTLRLSGQASANYPAGSILASFPMLRHLQLGLVGAVFFLRLVWHRATLPALQSLAVTASTDAAPLSTDHRRVPEEQLFREMEATFARHGRGFPVVRYVCSERLALCDTPAVRSDQHRALRATVTTMLARFGTRFEMEGFPGLREPSEAPQPSETPVGKAVKRKRPAAGGTARKLEGVERKERKPAPARRGEKGKGAKD